MRLEFKFRESAPADRRERVIEQVREVVAVRIEPQFPDESDPQLASLFKAEDVPEDRADELVEKLGGMDDVEFAGRTPQRRLIP